jgi:hypothetical protein
MGVLVGGCTAVGGTGVDVLVLVGVTVLELLPPAATVWVMVGSICEVDTVGVAVAPALLPIGALQARAAIIKTISEIVKRFDI